LDFGFGIWEILDFGFEIWDLKLGVGVNFGFLERFYPVLEFLKDRVFIRM